MNIYIKKMGCKVNEYEASSLMTSLKEYGHIEVATPEEADIAIVVTCAVTNEAEAKSRQMVGSITSKNPNIKIIICGCSSQNNPLQYERKENVVAVFGMNKLDIVSFVQNMQNDCQFEPKCYISETYEDYTNPQMDKTRHFVKIQDGCNNFCSYCLIPYVRGRSRSRKLNEVVEEIKQAQKESKEVVLTGINVSDYHTDRGETFVDLLKAIQTIDIRLRISSIECNVISRELLAELQKCKNFCPHFHLPLQSGANQTLKDMNRHYNTAQFLEKVNLIREYFPDCAVTTDVIVGFPTETDADFEETLQTIKTANFSDIHAFAYSERSGTAISKQKKPLDRKVLKERKAKMLALKKELHNAFLVAHIGKTASMLTENIKGNYIVGYTKEYIKVLLPKDSVECSQTVDVELVEISGDAMLGKLIE